MPKRKRSTKLRDFDTHEKAVKAVVEKYGAQRKGFAAAMRKVLHVGEYARKPDCDCDECGEDYADAVNDEEGWTSLLRIVPDAWTYDASKRLLTVYEVTNTHPVKGAKLERYANLWFYLDCEEIDLLVIEVQAIPGYPAAPIDLSLTWWEQLSTQVAG